MSHDSIIKSTPTTFRGSQFDDRPKVLRPIIKVSTASMTTDSKTKFGEISEKTESNLLNVRNLSIPEEQALHMPIGSMQSGIETEQSLTETDENKYSLASSRRKINFWCLFY